MSENPFSPEELFEFTQSQNHTKILKEDRKIAISLLVMAYQAHPNIVDVCLYFSYLKISEDTFLESTEVSQMIIEDVLAPDIFQAHAIAQLGLQLSKGCFESPLWFYLARSAFGKTDDFKNLLLTHFSNDAAYFTEIMERTGDLNFLGTIENELKRLVPYVKYLPMHEDSHELVPSHDQWLRIGSAYVRLWRQTQKVVPQISSVLTFLESKFFHEVPETVEEWKASASPEEKKFFQSESNIYNTHFEIIKV